MKDYSLEKLAYYLRFTFLFLLTLGFVVHLYAAPTVRKGVPVLQDIPMQSIGNTGVSDINKSGMQVYAWESRKTSGSNVRGVFVKRTDRNGNIIGDVLNVAPNETGYQINPSVSIANDGSFIVAYESQDSVNGSNYNLYISRYDSSGNLIGQPQNISNPGTSQHYNPVVTIQKENKRFVVVYSAGTSLSQNSAYWKFFGADGVPLHIAPLAISTTKSTFQITAAASENGTMLMAWIEEVTAGSFTYQLVYRIVDINGFDFLTNPVSVGATTNVYSPHVSISDKGDGIVAWVESSGANPKGLKYRRINSRGEVVGNGPSDLATGIPYQSNVRTRVCSAVNSDGEYGFVFNSNDIVYTKLFSSSATPLLDEAVAAGQGELQRFPTLSWTNDGQHGLVTWSTGNSNRIYSQMYRPINLQPSINPLTVLEYYPNPTIKFTITANDPNPFDIMSYQMTGSIPPNSYIHPTTGQFEWAPPSFQSGTTVPITFRATDDGTPPLYSESTFNIKVLQHQSAVGDWNLY